jgi:nucleotidyltransferase substrate binding protein (TIGR01987 family)
MTDGALSVRVGQLARALQRLEEALARPVDPIVRDACIQRFEFTFEMAWKAIRHYATGEGLACASPRECFRTAFQLGLIANSAEWLAMLEDRNRTTQTYDEESAEAIYRALPAYAAVLRGLLARLAEGEQRRAEDASR